jgi:hypothetical protein
MDSEAIWLELRHIFPSSGRKYQMEQEFDAIAFVQHLNQGDYDGHLQEELCKLTAGQLNEVSVLVTVIVKKRPAI